METLFTMDFIDIILSIIIPFILTFNFDHTSVYQNDYINNNNSNYHDGGLNDKSNVGCNDNGNEIKDVRSKYDFECKRK